MEVTHGCIRLYPEDIDVVRDRADRTPGEFVYQPVKSARARRDLHRGSPRRLRTRFNYSKRRCGRSPTALKDRVDWTVDGSARAKTGCADANLGRHR